METKIEALDLYLSFIKRIKEGGIARETKYVIYNQPSFLVGEYIDNYEYEDTVEEVVNKIINRRN